MNSGHTVDLDRESTSVEICPAGTQENEPDSTSKAEIIRRLLRPVKEKHSSKEAEEIRITQLYNHALQMSSESESSLEAIPLLESIVHSFLFRSSSVCWICLLFRSCYLFLIILESFYLECSTAFENNKFR